MPSPTPPAPSNAASEAVRAKRRGALYAARIPDPDAEWQALHAFVLSHYGFDVPSPLTEPEDFYRTINYAASSQLPPNEWRRYTPTLDAAFEKLRLCAMGLVCGLPHRHIALVLKLPLYTIKAWSAQYVPLYHRFAPNFRRFSALSIWYIHAERLRFSKFGPDPVVGTTFGTHPHLTSIAAITPQSSPVTFGQPAPSVVPETPVWASIDPKQYESPEALCEDYSVEAAYVFVRTMLDESLPLKERLNAAKSVLELSGHFRSQPAPAQALAISTPALPDDVAHKLLTVLAETTPRTPHAPGAEAVKGGPLPAGGEA